MRQKIKFVGQLWSQQIFVICCSMRQKASSSSWFAYSKEKQQLGRRQNIIIMMSSCHAMPRSFDDKVKIKKCSCHILGNLIWIHHLLLSRYYIFFDTLEESPPICVPWDMENGRQFLTCDSKSSISGSGHSIGSIKTELSGGWRLRLLLEVEVGGHTPIIPIINPS